MLMIITMTISHFNVCYKMAPFISHILRYQLNVNLEHFWRAIK
jgi:hypothetical protein